MSTPFLLEIGAEEIPDWMIPGALENLRSLCSQRVIVVFGAGGDRDRNKRPKMARAVLGADMIVVTSDNPRTEDPQRIIDDILTGFAPSFPPLHIEPDRRVAIAWALDHARPGDCVLIAGKGHETEQIIGTRRFPFDDREVVRKAWPLIRAGVDVREHELEMTLSE